MNKNKQTLDKLNLLLRKNNLEDFYKELSDVARAQGGFTKMARETGISKFSLYRLLSEKGNAQFEKMLEILNYLGLSIKLEVNKEKLELDMHGVPYFEGAWLDLYFLSPGERLKYSDNVINHFHEINKPKD